MGHGYYLVFGMFIVVEWLSVIYDIFFNWPRAFPGYFTLVCYLFLQIGFVVSSIETRLPLVSKYVVISNTSRSHSVKGHTCILVFCVTSSDPWVCGRCSEFFPMRHRIYHGAKGALFVCDITNQESFDHIPPWLDELVSRISPNTMVMLLGVCFVAASRERPRPPNDEVDFFPRCETQLRRAPPRRPYVTS